MLGQKRIKAIVEAILARSVADQTEVVVLAGDEHLTRFANSTIHQNVAERNAEVRIRVVLRPTSTGSARIGAAATNNLDDAALNETLEKALAIARLQPENPDFASLPGPQPVSEVDAFSEATAGCTPEQRARGAGTICLMARDAGVMASGALTTKVVELAVANSLGVFAYFPTAYADFNTVVLSDTGAGYSAALALDVNDLDFEALGREAVEKCLHGQDPRALDPGDYAVILEPYAVQDFVQMMAFTGFGAVAMQEGRGFMVGKIGQRIVDPRISIWDDGLDPDGVPWPFDFEGVPKQRVDFIDEGTACGVVYDSYRAGKEEGRASTGHAILSPYALGPFPMNTFFATGESSLQEMIASTDRGLYITRFHYTRPAEPTKVVVTGTTRDGTFLIEKGEIAYPVKNLRFTQSYLEAFNHVEMVGKESRLLSGFMGVARDRVPALKLGRFRFTGATEF
jgi:predicted Zn-dependent protease